MGGRGATSGSANAWKKQLKQFAKEGVMPRGFAGSREQQKDIFEEIDKLYSMPTAEGARIIDRGGSVWVMYKGKTTQKDYPSKENASQAEKNGVLKWLLWNM